MKWMWETKRWLREHIKTLTEHVELLENARNQAEASARSWMLKAQTAQEEAAELRKKVREQVTSDLIAVSMRIVLAALREEPIEPFWTQQQAALKQQLQMMNQAQAVPYDGLLNAIGGGLGGFIPRIHQ